VSALEEPGDEGEVPEVWNELSDDALSDADEEKQKIAQKRLARMTRHYHLALCEAGFSAKAAFGLTRDLHWAMLELAVQSKMDRAWREGHGDE
jgi:hypothetical protein